MNHRLRAVGAATFALVLIVPACSADKPTAKGSPCPVGAFEHATAPVNVTVWHSYVGKTRQTLQSLADEYNAKHPKVHIDVQAQGNSYQELLRNYAAVLPSKKLPAITIGEDIDTRYMVDTKSVLPAQSCIDADSDPRAKLSDMLPAIRNHYTVDGQLYPATVNGSTVVIYYNKAHFKKANLDPEKPPTTLDQLYDDAVKLKAAKASSGEPFVLKTDPWFVEHLITGAGQPIVDHDNGRSGLAEKSTFDNPATHRIFEWLAKMKSAGLINAVAGTDSTIDHYLAMATGSASMLLETSTAITTVDGVINGTFNAADLGQADNPAVAKYNGVKIPLDIGVGPVPGLTEAGKGQVGGGAWYITNTSSDEVKSAAWDFVKWYNETAQQARWTLEGSYLPIMKSVKDDPTVAKAFTSDQRGKWLATASGALATLDEKFNGPIIGPYTKVRDIIRGSIDKLLSGATTPDAAIKDADSGITAALADYKSVNG